MTGLVVVGAERDDARRRCIANAVGFELFAGDGRPIFTGKGGIEQINVDDEEMEFILRVADRVLTHLRVDGMI